MVSLRGALVMPPGLDGGAETAQKPPTALSASLTPRLLPPPIRSLKLPQTSQSPEAVAIS